MVQGIGLVSFGGDSCGAESRVMALFQRNVVESQDSQSWEGMLVGKKEKCLKRWGSDLDEMAVRWVEQTSERRESGNSLHGPALRRKGERD